MNLNEIKQLWRSSIALSESELSSGDMDLSAVSVFIHNASWCPDCEREVSQLLSIDGQVSQGFREIVLESYEDKESYKAEKSKGQLKISCLPTIIFYRKGVEVARIEEDSNGEMLRLLSNIRG